MRRPPWGWNPAGRRRWAMVTLWTGHLIWVLLGRGPSLHWQQVLDLLSRPSQVMARNWGRWHQNRAATARSLGEAQAEIQNLRWQVEGLRTAMLRDASRTAEAEEAIRLLGLKQQLPLELKAARVIVNVRRAPFGGMVMDQGRDAGLAPEQGVICPEGVVGRVWAISDHQASLLPLDAYNASTAVMLGRSRATGVLQGVGPNRAEIRYVGAQEIVQPGEPVFTSGLDGVFPRGLLVGTVSSVHPRDTELRIQVSLAAPLDKVDQVLILPSRPQIELPVPAAPPVVAPKGKRGPK